MLLIALVLIGAAAAAAFSGSRAARSDPNVVAWMIARERDRAWDWDEDR